VKKPIAPSLPALSDEDDDAMAAFQKYADADDGPSQPYDRHGPTIEDDNKTKMDWVRLHKRNADPWKPFARTGRKAELDRMALEVERAEKAEFEQRVKAEVEKRLASLISPGAGATRRKVVDGQHGGWRPGAGRPTSETSEAQQQPWLALGLSKATYYRRKRNGELG
jgi:hypothetical protein